MTSLLLLAVPSPLGSAALAATLTVDPDDSSAYESVALALEDAEDGDTISVVAGWFEDCLVIEELQVEIVGAGAGSTVLDGDGDCDPLVRLDDGAAVTFSELTLTNEGQPAISAEDSTLLLDAVTVEESGDASSYYYGGAAIILEGSDLTVTDSSFDANEGYYGGHLHVGDRSSATLSGSSFTDGYAVYGGAFYVDGLSELHTEDLTVSGSEAWYYGGAVYITGHSAWTGSGDAFTDNTTVGGYYYNYGGAVYAGEFAALELSGSTFEANTAAYGGAIFLTGYGSLDLSELTLAGNEATYSGGALYAASGSAVTDSGSAWTDNHAGSYAGAAQIYDNSRMDVTGSRFEGNETLGAGGALYYNSGSSGTVDGADFTDNVAGESAGALRVYAADETFVVRDSTFTDNIAETHYGGAIDAQIDVDLVVESSTFEGNLAGTYGGAITAWYDSALTVSDSSFESNHSLGANSGAITFYSYYSGTFDEDLVISGSRFVGNTAAYDSGAVYAGYARSVVIEDSWFEENEGSQVSAEDYNAEGGALYLYANTDVSVHRSTFCGNSAGSGGAAYVYYNTTDTWTNNIFVGNVALRGGSLMHYYVTETSQVNNTFAGNVARDVGAVEYFIYGALEFVNNAVVDSGTASAVDIYDSTSASASRLEYDGFYGNDGGEATGAWSPAEEFEGHVFEDPLFVDWTDDGDCSNDDLRLGQGSPFRDAGDPEILDGDGTRSDIGAYGGPEAEAQDFDGDGYSTASDCDDFDAEVNPGATEVCNDIDDDCNGIIDGEDSVDLGTWYTDADGDGWGDEDSAEEACEAPEGTVAEGGDCDDSDATVYPGAEDIPGDDIDQDCDGEDASEGGGDAGGGSGGPGGKPDDADLSACGCAATGAPARAAWLLVLPALVMLRRRRA